MRRISLLKLTLRNFKGIRDFTLETNGTSTEVFGDNAVGKTTLFDAFTWLLFDKDSQNKKDFQIKTLDSCGNVLHGVEHEVEGVLLVDGKRITLRKVYAEKWTKKRGSATAEFTGHTTDYFVDGVPVKMNEYKERVDQIVSEDVFKLLTNPTYFNEQLKWQERRKILLQVCGDISDDDVIASNRELAKLPSILNGRNIEDHRKVIAARRAEINKELDKIPVRIDEVQRSMPDTSSLNEESLQQNITTLTEQLDSKEAELFRIRSGGEIVVKEKRLREIEGELLEIKNQLQAGTLEKVGSKRQEVSALKGDYDELVRQVRDKSRTIERNKQWIIERQAEADRLRQQWHEVNGEMFEHHHDTDCPTCGQALPEEKIQAAHQKAQADFNRRKAERLEQITARGKTAADEAKRLEQENALLASEIEVLERQVTSKEKEIQEAEFELNELQTGIKSVGSDPGYLQKKQEATVIHQEIEQLRSSVQEAAAKVRDEIVDLKAKVEALEQEKAKFAQVRAAKERIAELSEREKELAAEFERLEQELFLTEEFIRTKVNLLEEKINSKFRYARFKLFEQQINGGLAEVCETTFNGVPYSSGLNNAARINVGLDIINTLSEHYGITAPIFIDNAEAVTRMMETIGQQIRLIVSEKDKQLRVETPQSDMKEAV
ncbi:AAA family ATPase [Brevibacillus borstelensis]|uniref:AAA family ATPase n=1 Tax=Brevibacillus borstelensis TaxID=45462 RepID=UPI00203FAA61|nr:AAA family ATPase [Brevibacillus borstelensis]MCM3560627.1 AAA family ATPase [Brevibacillus borstelensis]